jgi:hypothetical protein
MVFTGGRRDLNYHGWLVFAGSGRAKFSDGTLVAFEAEKQRGKELECLDTGLFEQAGEASGGRES